jgi:hypothetical protein
VACAGGGGEEEDAGFHILAWYGEGTEQKAGRCDSARDLSRLRASRPWALPLRDCLDESIAMRQRMRQRRMGSVGFALAGGELLEDGATELLEVAEAREIVLKFLVEDLRLLGTELRAENHVAEFDRMRKERVFLQFFERDFCVVVVHGVP